jgi:hypothetical protein
VLLRILCRLPTCMSQQLITDVWPMQCNDVLCCVVQHGRWQRQAQEGKAEDAWRGRREDGPQDAEERGKGRAARDEEGAGDLLHATAICA